MGGIWLWEHHWLAYFGGVSLLWVILMVVFIEWRSHVHPSTDAPNGASVSVEADDHWPPSASPAWQEVTSLAERVSLKDYPLDNYNRLLQLGQQTVELVARHYFPESAKPHLEIDLRSLLRIVELVSRDLREELSATFPASHLIKIGWIPKAHRTYKLSQKAWQGYRISSMIINPIHALTQELRSQLIQKNIVAPMIEELHGWLLNWYVKKVGFYAIALYAGTLTINDPTSEQTRYSREDLEAIAQQNQPTTAEPLRLWVAGQLKAGKSSLVNALFGELRAATDVLTCTTEITAYRLQRDGIDLALVLDSPGYTEQAQGQWSRAWRNELLRVDFILLVVSALQAARHADYQQLTAIRVLYQSQLSRRMPPVILALSHIDQLRPVREWSPPYNVDQPQRPKERSIRGAMEAVAKELDVPLEDVIPVNLKAGNLYNVEEGLFAAIMVRLNEAERAKYLRCLDERRTGERWSYLWEQVRCTGRIVTQFGKHLTDS
jgi:hypothetical protein